MENADDKKNVARASGRSLAISTKHSVEISSFIRNRKLADAKKILEGVIAKKVAVPFNRYNRDVAHKKGIAAGRYPIKAADQILRLIESAEANAQNKGLDVGSLVVERLVANKGPNTRRAGRHRWSAKRTHVEVMLKPMEKSEDKK